MALLPTSAPSSGRRGRGLGGELRVSPARPWGEMVVNPSMRAEGEGGTDGAPPAIRRAPRLSAEGLSEPRTALQRSHAGTEGRNDGLVGARAPDSRAEPRGPSPLSSSPSPRGRPSARRQPLWLAVLPGGRGGACMGSLGSDHLGLPAGPDVRGRCAALRGAPHAAATQKATAPLRAAGRMQPRGLLLLLALLLLAATAEAAKAKKEKAKKEGSECQDWRWGPCVPNSKDCGLGYREGTCGDESRKLKCKIPCNWKKKFGADCKYKFESWGGCSAQTGVKTRSGILKKALYNAQCEEVVYVSKPCAAKMKAKAKAKKGKGKD